MHKLIKIKDRIDGFLSLQFIDLLNDIEPFCADLIWSIYDLEIFVKTGGIPDYSELLDNIDNATNGYPISWLKLKNYAKKISQVVNMILVASDKKNFRKYDCTSEWRTKFKIGIEILDGDYWEVYSSNEKLISFLKDKYKNTEVFDSIATQQMRLGFIK